MQQQKIIYTWYTSSQKYDMKFFLELKTINQAWRVKLFKNKTKTKCDLACDVKLDISFNVANWHFAITCYRETCEVKTKVFGPVSKNAILIEAFIKKLLQNGGFYKFLRQHNNVSKLHLHHLILFFVENWVSRA